GTLYTVLFKVAKHADEVVHLTTAPTTPVATPQPFAVASVLRALRTQTVLPGQHAADLPPPALPDTRVTITDSQVLALGQTLGLVLRLRSTQVTPLALDLRIGSGETPPEGVVALSTWTWPPRLTIRAVAADDEVRSEEGQTRVYIVLERRP